MRLVDLLQTAFSFRYFWAISLPVVAMVASCAAPTAPPTATPAPLLAASRALGMKPFSDFPTSQTSGPDKLPMDEIFPPGGKGRELALNNCILCHSIIRIVWGPRTVEDWQNVKFQHRTRLRRLADDEFDMLFAYLMESFSPDKPYPSLPQWYLDSVTP